MKKILSILAVIGLTATTGATVVACGNGPNEENPSTYPEIKLKSLPSAISEGKKIEIVIENYHQIQKTLTHFTLSFNDQDQKNPSQNVVLEQVGDFDTTNGKFSVQANQPGKVYAIVKADYQDKNLGQEPITARVLVNVIPTGAELLKIQTDKSELEVNDENDYAVIKIIDYEYEKNKWDHFTLNITTLEAPVSNWDVVFQADKFDPDRGEFKVGGLTPGKVIISISATPISGLNKQNLKVLPRTFGSNEITITVKKITMEFMINDKETSNAFGYGLTGNEFIEAAKSSFCEFSNAEYGRDYQILNLKPEEKLLQNAEVVFIAGQDSKIFTGRGTLKLIHLDIWRIKDNLQSIAIGTLNQELEKQVQAAVSKIMPNAKIRKDFWVEDQAVAVGKPIRIGTDERSELLAGSIDLAVVGESYANWELDKLNVQTQEFVGTMKKLIEENKKTEPFNSSPVDNPKLKDQWVENYFQMYSFFTRVFLETKYAVVADGEKIEIKKIDDSVEYEQAKEDLLSKLDDTHQLGNNKEYETFFNGCHGWLRKS